jgi:hypothetical protein
VSSQIAAIVDYSAMLAGGIQGVRFPNGTTGGVRSTYGAGQGLYTDPLRPGQTIAPAPEAPLEAYMHVSDLPDAPTVTPITQDGTVELTWMVPMRLYVPRGDIRTLRATLLPFYGAYLAAFIPQWTLGGLAILSYIASFKVEADDDWGWLAMELRVIEQVSF